MAAYNALDFFIIIVALVGAFLGVYRGFVYTLLNFAGKILSAILAVRFLEMFMKVLNIKDLFLKGVMNVVKDYVPLSEEIKNMSLQNGSINIEGSPLEGNMFGKIMGENISREIEHLYEAGRGYSLDTVGEMIALILSNYILNILSFIVLFLIFLVGFSIIRSILVKIVGISSFTTSLDKLLGFVFGAGINIFILSFVVGVSYDLLNLVTLKDSGILSVYKGLINDSQLQEYLYMFYSMIISEGTKLL